MHNLPPIPIYPVPGGALPPGFSSRGLPAPSGILPPPPGFVEARELAVVKYLNANSQTPQGQQFTELLADRGDRELWFDFARQYRQSAGLIRGWLGTALMGVAMGVAALKARGAKNHYQRLRPYYVDGTILPLGQIENSPSYPSGHATSAYAAATVLSYLWPARAYEFNWWARQTALSRVAGGHHFPSDVRVGAMLGRKVGMQVGSIIR